MKKLKRVLAVLLTAIMTLAMATTAFAAENQGSLKVTVNQGNTLNGQTIKVYKLFDLTVSGSHYAYTVKIPTGMELATPESVKTIENAAGKVVISVKQNGNKAEVELLQKTHLIIWILVTILYTRQEQKRYSPPSYQ